MHTLAKVITTLTILLFLICLASKEESPRKRRVKEQLTAGYFSYVWPPRKENVYYKISLIGTCECTLSFKGREI